MKKTIHILLFFFLLTLSRLSDAQTTTAAPYCCGPYTTGQCNQPGASNAPGNFINDFINDFSTTGANTNISNLNSGCNGNSNNCVNYCSHYIAVSPGQTLVCTMASGNTFAQGFAIWVDWNQDNVHGATEYMGGTAGVPAAATPTTITFTIPTTQANGVYRMRVRCAFATVGSAITPCGTFGFGETEDYTIYVGSIPPNSAVPSGTALVNSPVCIGQPLNFSLTTNYTAPLSYTWTGPGSFSSTLQNPMIANTTTAATGIYTVLISNSICPTTSTVSALVVAYPSFTPLPATHTICQGGNFNATASLTSNPTLYSYFWASTAPGQIFNPGLQSTMIIPALLPSTVPLANYVYSITVSPNLNTSCAVTKTIGLTINNPLTPTLTMPSTPLCDVHNPVQLTAAPGGGTWSANPAVSQSGLFSPVAATIGVNSVLYSVSSGTCIVSNTGTILVSRYISPALSSTISTSCVQDPPINLMNIVQNTVTGRWNGHVPTTLQIQNNIFNPAGLVTGNYTLKYNTLSQPDTTACPDFTTLVVYVFNPPTPAINPIQAKCNTSGTVALSASPVGGNWTGNSGVSITGVQTPSLNSIGTNTVTYSAGLGTCVASSSRTFHVSRFNTAALLGVVPDLCVSNNPFNLMSITQNTNGSWSWNGPPTNINNFFNPAGLPTNTYVLTYRNLSTPIAGLCNDSSKITVKVLNPPAPIITQVGPYCSANGTVQLNANPAIGQWVASSYLNTNGVFTPSLCSVGDNIVQYIIGTSTCNSQQTKTISVEAFVSAALLSGVPDQCSTNPPVNLSPITANATGFWSGPGITGTSFNPGIAGAGNFILYHNTSSYPSGLCPDQATVAVQVFSLAAPSITQVGPFCNISAPVQLQVSPVGGLFESGTTGVVSPSGFFNPALGLIGDNFVSYSISVGPCLARTQTKISVEKFISAALAQTVSAAYCKNTLPFNLNSFVQNPDGIWSGGTGLEGSMFYPIKANIGANTFTYETHSSPTTLLCPDVSTIQIFVKDVPSIKIESNVYSGCAPLEVVLRTPSTNSGKGIWDLSDGSVTEDGLRTSHIFTSSGTYSVVFTYMEEGLDGCVTQATLETPITVSATPKADFLIYPEEISISDPEASLTNLSTALNDNYYQWTVTGLNSVNGMHPKISFPQIGKYKITLTATSIDGCKNETSKIIEVKNDFTVFIPNSFTPNYDGLNDVFMPVFSLYGLDAKTYQMEIFDRWGHELYRTNDVGKGWDGSLQNKGDETLKEGTYIFKIKYKDLEGKLYEKTGFLSLLPN